MVFKAYKRVSPSGKKGGKKAFAFYIPKKLAHIYEKIAFGETLGERYVVVYGNEENGILVIAPAKMEEEIEKIGLENIGKLLVKEGDCRGIP